MSYWPKCEQNIPVCFGNLIFGIFCLKSWDLGHIFQNRFLYENRELKLVVLSTIKKCWVWKKKFWSENFGSKKTFGLVKKNLGLKKILALKVFLFWKEIWVQKGIFSMLHYCSFWWCFSCSSYDMGQLNPWTRTKSITRTTTITLMDFDTIEIILVKIKTGKCSRIFWISIEHRPPPHTLGSGA